ncbi:dynein heavy chain 1, cytosolic [Phakopsora pachyrhizi]|uniref:Dynein heavy chain 1, cytosolic n=1 Tax=Phakopsora pachyrhizi TaxID=170000 RepID=A0AAV0AVJ6_PHAPC|nr:dynein heavy chain 1, cytosolic [Phakopsora pachyrhizi]
MQISLAKLLCNASEGKIESVKALGVQLGKFVLVFCGDKTFDFQAMGCFDEANTLEERILSAVSQQISKAFELVGKTLRINPHTGFQTAEKLASKVVPFFSLCGKQLSRQTHYYFGLRALKEVLTSAGHFKRARLLAGEGNEASFDSDDQAEQEILIQSVTETIVPKLVAEDVPLLKRQVFFNF